MPKVYIDVEGVTFDGKDAAVGDVIEVSDMGAKALIEEGKARPAGADGKPKDVDDEDTTAAGPTNPEANPQAAAEAEVEKQRQALDSQYKLDELKEAAKAAGVDFAFNATKAQVIDAIMEQGKATLLIK